MVIPLNLLTAAAGWVISELLPREVTINLVEHEMQAVYAWAERHKVQLNWNPLTLHLQVRLVQPETDDRFFLLGLFEGYREEPPAWIFSDSSWSQSIKRCNYPLPLIRGPWGSSVFHSSGLICAPFNRLAYAAHHGPHPNWGSLTGWLHAGDGTVRATTIGDMLQVIRRDFLLTRGRMA